MSFYIAIQVSLTILKDLKNLNKKELLLNIGNLKIKVPLLKAL